MTKIYGVFFLLFLVGVVLFSSAFVLNQTQLAFITQFGKPVGDAIVEPGLKFKIPFIQKVRFFDKRFLEWDGDPNQLPTKDKRYISIDIYARWRIKDPLMFFENVRDESGAQTRLDDILDGATRNAVARHNLVDVIRSKEREIRRDADDAGEFESKLSDFEYGRAKIANDILASAKVQLENWGIELLDVRFKRIQYEVGVQRKIFERMKSERQRIAQKFRSEGEGEAAKIHGERERELKTIESEAFRQVQEIQGRADAEATRIYAGAYDQSPEAREFYRFLKTMETYSQSLSDKDSLILSTKGDFYRYLNEIGTGR